MAPKHKRINDNDKTKLKKNSSINCTKESSFTRLFCGPLPSVVIFICATMCGIINSIHVSTMFENDRHFSHLSTLEREMTFRTEMGLYYSYYKTIIEAESFLGGLNRLMHDNLTEYPDHINTLQRFNLYPEVVLGGAYRIFTNVITSMGLEMKVCWQVSRSGGLPPVISCEGLQDPVYWYLSGVWLSAGLTAAFIFLHGTQLSGTLVGGMLSVICFFFNHGEATRVQWTPPLRESFAFPWSIAINLVVTEAMRAPKASWVQPILLGNLVLNYLVCWQFAQFTLVIVMATVYCMYSVGMISPLSMLLVLLGSIYGFINTLGMQFGNTLLLASPLAGCLVGILLLYIFLEPLISKLPAPTNIGTQLAFLFISSIASKMEISRLLGVEHDAHILNILKAKLTNYSDFHTLLYTCSAEFDFMPKDSIYKMSETLLIPCVVMISGAFIVSTLVIMKENFVKRIDDKREQLTPIWTGIDAGVMFNFILLIIYGVMAALIMRLKLFFTPQLCVFASLLACRKYWKNIKRKDVHLAILTVLVSGMCVRGFKNIVEQRSIIGEYMDPHLEELIHWVQTDTTDEAVFAGPMPTMANLLLSTRRPIVNHPHYEYEPLRERTKKVYSVFSRRTPESVYETLLSMKVNYIVLEESWCMRKHKQGCGMVDLWDVEEPHNKKNPALCPKLFHRSPAPFHRVFSNDQYVVLQVPSKYVEIPAPRVHSS